DKITVFLHLAEVRRLSEIQVHSLPLQLVIEGLDIHIIAAKDVTQRTPEGGVRILPLPEAVQFSRQSAEGCRTFLPAARAVDTIVRSPAECVDGIDGAGFFLRKPAEGVIEAFRV